VKNIPSPNSTSAKLEPFEQSYETLKQPTSTQPDASQPRPGDIRQKKQAGKKRTTRWKTINANPLVQDIVKRLANACIVAGQPNWPARAKILYFHHVPQHASMFSRSLPSDFSDKGKVADDKECRAW
jgi:hypothetical protein